ncbi:MAG: hypothetical protein QGI88_11980, partial [SAR202 cluster bacterium]|nr:hypothetical protein [SAR202 cluster bacterium]
MNTQPKSDYVHHPAHAIPEILLEIEGLISAQNIGAYLVGGAVRDSLLGRLPADYDIAVTADASETARMLADTVGGHFVSLHLERDTARVVIPSDTNPIGIDFTHVHEDIETDLGRRDFTVNAIAAPLGDVVGGEWRIIDPHGGREDLDRHTIRAVAERVFNDDPARLM